MYLKKKFTLFSLLKSKQLSLLTDLQDIKTTKCLVEIKCLLCDHNFQSNLDTIKWRGKKRFYSCPKCNKEAIEMHKEIGGHSRCNII